VEASLKKFPGSQVFFSVFAEMSALMRAALGSIAELVFYVSTFVILISTE
jgi:hypothetical protein